MNPRYLVLAFTSAWLMSPALADDQSCAGLALTPAPAVTETVAKQLSLQTPGIADRMTVQMTFSYSDDSISADPSLAEMYRRAVKLDRLASLKRVQLSTHLKTSDHNFLVRANEAFEAKWTQVEPESITPEEPVVSLTEMSPNFEEVSNTEPNPVSNPYVSMRVINDTAAVPEPETWILFGVGGIVLAIYSRKRPVRSTPVPVKA